MNSALRLASIDIGYSNFGQYVEDFCPITLLKIQAKYAKLPKNKQRRIKGPMIPDIEALLIETYLCGKRVQTGVYNFTDAVGQGLDIRARLKLINHLNDNIELWSTCDIFIIEQQFFKVNFGNKRGAKAGVEANITALKIAEFVFMWFLERYPFKTISYFGSQFKTQILGAPWKLTKPQRKKWAVDKAEEIYILRGDEDMITLYELAEAVKRKRINTQERVTKFKGDFPCYSADAEYLSTKIICEKQKLDDIADTCVSAQAYKFRTFVACF
jgi:hypothetical protein